MLEGMAARDHGAMEKPREGIWVNGEHFIIHGLEEHKASATRTGYPLEIQLPLAEAFSKFSRM